MKKIPLLGGLTPAQFLRDYWHKKPLLIRQAIPGFTPLLSSESLFEMAADDTVEARLITHFRNRWRIANGPIEQLPSVTQRNWTLLVQGVDLHHDAAHQLLSQFRFIPDARLDDLMISFATDGGGVGPHFDSYDVFLLQAQGRRRWRISAQKDLSLRSDMPLKILRDFKPEQEFVLEPGDMLYLPPHYAHEGIAIGECMTYSIGFRAPSYQELGEAFLHFMADSVELSGRYADPNLRISNRPAEISRSLLEAVEQQLNRIRFTKADIAVFLGEFLSEPKPNVFFDRPAQALPYARFVQAAAAKGIKLSRKSRMLYHGRHLFINGESFGIEREQKPALARLADKRELSGEILKSSDDDVLETLYIWYQDGWILIC